MVDTERLRVRVRNRLGEAVRGVPPSPAITAEAGDVLRVELAGAEPFGVIELAIGREHLPIRADADGAAQYSDRGALDAVAGRLRVRADGLEVAVDVRPSKLTESALRAMLDDLEALAAGLSNDLGGRAEGALSSESPHPDALLSRLENVVGAVGEAAAWVRRRPLHRVDERVRPVPANSPRLSARDARWLARSPAAVALASARAPGRALAVRRDRRLDLDLPENRGVIGLLDHLRGLVEALGRAVDDERARLAAGRNARERFRTRRGNLFDERDRPRLAALDVRFRRISLLRADLERARVRSGLPPDLPGAHLLPRTAAVEGHPGYWNLRVVWERLHGVGRIAPSVELAPLDDLDTLYEVWCATQVVAALADRAGRRASEVIQIRTDGWFARLAPGEIAAVLFNGIDGTDDSSAIRATLEYEPEIAHGGSGELARLTRGAPLRPDLVLTIRRAGHPPHVHIFDAKHRIAREHPHQVPRDTLHEIWARYGEDIVFRADQLPAIRSVWILYPAAVDTPYLVSRRMLDSAWPPDRLRVGAIPLVPGCPQALGAVLDALWDCQYYRAL